MPMMMNNFQTLHRLQLCKVISTRGGNEPSQNFTVPGEGRPSVSVMICVSIPISHLLTVFTCPWLNRFGKALTTREDPSRGPLRTL